MIHIVSWIVSSTTLQSQFGTLTLTPLRVIAIISISCLLHPQNDQMGFEVSHYRELTYGKLGFNLDPKKKIAKDPHFLGC